MYMNNGQPPLIDTVTGGLNQLWVHWYSHRTGSSIQDTIAAGVMQMLELQQRMIGFIREHTINPRGVAAGYMPTPFGMPNYGPGFMGGGFMNSGFNRSGQFENAFGQDERTGPYSELNASEPSLFYKLDERVKEGEFSHPWVHWMARGPQGQSMDIQELEVERLRRVEQLESIPRPRTRFDGQGPAMTTPAGYVSLMWVIWQGTKATNETYQEIHDKLVEYLKVNKDYHQTDRT